MNRKNHISVSRPSAHVIAGPNGSGKTTFALKFLPEIAGCRNFVNADLIAGGLSPLRADAAAMEAGRLFLRQIRARTEAREPFAFETTLSGLTYAPFFKAMRAAGFSVRLYFLWVPSVELALRRIRERVRQGGHDVPEDVVRRRYARGLSNLFSRYLGLADYVCIFDNTELRPRLVYERTASGERMVDPSLFARIAEQGRKSGGANL